MRMRVPLALAGLVIVVGFAVTPPCAQTAALAQTLSPSSIPEAAPTPTLGDDVGQVLPDGRVIFRLLAPNAQSVSVVVGTNIGEVTTRSRGHALLVGDSREVTRNLGQICSPKAKPFR